MRKIWNPRTVAESMAVECPIVLRSETVEKDEAERRKPGPGENNLINYYVAVWLEMGGQPLSEPVRFPAHEPLDARLAFATAMAAALMAGGVVVAVNG
jgi:hypothetical protein